MQIGEKELSIVVWTYGILFTAIGSLILVGGSLFMLLLQRHREHNSGEHDDFKDIDERLFTKVDNIEGRLSRLEGEHHMHCRKED